jgi:hypothetical protein
MAGTGRTMGSSPQRPSPDMARLIVAPSGQLWFARGYFVSLQIRSDVFDGSRWRATSHGLATISGTGSDWRSDKGARPDLDAADEPQWSISSSPSLTPGTPSPWTARSRIRQAADHTFPESDRQSADHAIQQGTNQKVWIIDGNRPAPHVVRNAKPAPQKEGCRVGSSSCRGPAGASANSHHGKRGRLQHRGCHCATAEWSVD